MRRAPSRPVRSPDPTPSPPTAIGLAADPATPAADAAPLAPADAGPAIRGDEAVATAGVVVGVANLR